MVAFQAPSWKAVDEFYAVALALGAALPITLSRWASFDPGAIVACPGTSEAGSARSAGP